MYRKEVVVVVVLIWKKEGNYEVVGSYTLLQEPVPPPACGQSVSHSRGGT